MANTSGVAGSGGASKKSLLSDAVEKQIIQDAKGTHVGRKVVRSITWAAGADIPEQIGNYVKSCFNDDYAQGVRDEFFNQMQELVKSNFNGTGTVPNEKPKTLGELIKDIKDISDEDLPEAKKNELITQAYEATKEAAKKELAGADSNKLDRIIQNIEKMPIEVLSEAKKNELIIELWKTVQESQEPGEAEPLAVDLDTYEEVVEAETFSADDNVVESRTNIDNSLSTQKYQKAIDYFKNEKTKIQNDLLKKDEITKMPQGLVNKEIKSEKDLKDFVKAVIEEKVKNCKDNEDHIDIDKLKHLEKEIGQYIDKEKSVAFSPEEKKELMMLARCAWKKEETMQGVAEMLKGALKMEGAADMAIAKIRANKNLMDRQFTTDEGLIEFQKECIQAGINAMLEGAKGNTDKLSLVKNNVSKFFDRMPTALSANDKKVMIQNITNSKTPAVEQQKVETFLNKDERNNIPIKAEKDIIWHLTGTGNVHAEFLKKKFEELNMQHTLNTATDMHNYINALMEAAIDYLIEQEGDLKNLKNEVDGLLNNPNILLSDAQKAALNDRVTIAKIRKETMDLIKKMPLGVDSKPFKAQCAAIEKEGDLDEIKNAFMDIQLKCIQDAYSKLNPSASITGHSKFTEILNAATLVPEVMKSSWRF